MNSLHTREKKESVFVVNTHRHTGTRNIFRILDSCVGTGTLKWSDFLTGIVDGENKVKGKKLSSNKYDEVDYQNIIINFQHQYELYKNPESHDKLFGNDFENIYVLATYRHPLSVLGTSIRRLCHQRGGQNKCCNVKIGNDVCQCCLDEFMVDAIKKIRLIISTYKEYLELSLSFKRERFYKIKTDLLAFKTPEYRVSFFDEIFDSTGLIPTQETYKLISDWKKYNTRLKEHTATDDKALFYQRIEDCIFKEKSEISDVMKRFCSEDIFSEYSGLVGFNTNTMKGVLDVKTSLE